VFFLVVVVEWFQVFHSCFQSWCVCNLKNNWMLWKLQLQEKSTCRGRKECLEREMFCRHKRLAKNGPFFVVHCWAIHLDIIKSMEKWWILMDVGECGWMRGGENGAAVFSEDGVYPLMTHATWQLLWIPH